VGVVDEHRRVAADDARHEQVRVESSRHEILLPALARVR
jgi:hypothetical protein